MKLSIVSPVYRAEKIIPVLIERIEKSVKTITHDYEIILVCDGSPDNSWSEIQKAAETNNLIKGIQLSRNFGQHVAITAGLDHVSGDWVVVMDCDLQDQPEEIEKLYSKAKEGYDIVLASRKQRQDTFFKRFVSKVFYSFLSYLTGKKMDPSIANFGIYHNSVINSIKQMRESIRYFPTMVKWVGFKSTKLEVEHGNRYEGKTAYNFKKLFKLGLDIILSYSDKPLTIMIKSGLLVSLVSIIVALVYFIKYLTGDIVVLGFTSLIVSIWFLSGIVISMVGIVGLYVGKTFEGVKNRPIYLIKTKLNS